MNAEELIARSETRQSILSCTSCHLHHTAKPVPFDGPSPAHVLVLGEAPGRTENAEGVPFVGKSGVLLRQLLDEAGFAMPELTFANSVCCFPDRTPTPGEINACTGNLERQIEVVHPRWIIAVGGISVSALCNTPVRMGEVRGIWFRPSRPSLSYRPWVLATYHPAAVLRNAQLKADLTSDLFFAWLTVHVNEAPQLASFCLKCKSPEVEYVDDLPWCKTHLPKVAKKAKVK